MPEIKPYIVYRCMDCELEFWVRKNEKKISHYCPQCGLEDYVSKQGTFHVAKPFYYNRRWTDVEDEILVSGIMMGKTYQEISQELDGRTKNGIHSRTLRLKETGRFHVLSELWRENKGFR